VRRDSIVEDSFRAFVEAAGSGAGGSERFKARFQVTFINREGLPEAGIDGDCASSCCRGFLDEFTMVLRLAFRVQVEACLRSLWTQSSRKLSRRSSPCSAQQMVGTALHVFVFSHACVVAVVFTNHAAFRYVLLQTIGYTRTRDAGLHLTLRTLRF
jgi:hypothetical protein